MFCNSIKSSVKYNFWCLTTPPLHKLINSNKSTTMTVLKGQAELDSFKLTKKEVADYLGISTNAVRMSMKGNNYHDLEYRFDGYQYLFKVPTRPRVDIVDHTTPGPKPRSNKTSTLGITPRSSKVVNRGATHRGEANYKNQATKLYNEGKIIKNIEDKFKSPEHKRIFNEMTQANWDMAYEQSLKEKEAEFQKANPRINPRGTVLGGSPRTHGVYGGMLNGKGLQNIDNKEHQRLARREEEANGIKMQEKYIDKPQMDGSYKRELTRINVPDFQDRSSSSSFFVGRAVYDDFSQDYHVDKKDVAVSFSQYDLDRYGKPEERTEFKSKVEESIYRTKKHLLKTKGSY